MIRTGPIGRAVRTNTYLMREFMTLKRLSDVVEEKRLYERLEAATIEHLKILDKIVSEEIGEASVALLVEIYAGGVD